MHREKELEQANNFLKKELMNNKIKMNENG
jgi:hypothetical protein